MGTKLVRFTDFFVDLARRAGRANWRSTSQQIEDWATIGRVMEDNPDLPYAFVRDAMSAQTKRDARQLEEYSFG